MTEYVRIEKAILKPNIFKNAASADKIFGTK